MGFQTTVNQQPAPGESGDFAGTNPRMSTSAGPGGYVAAPNYPTPNGPAPALVVGNFAWGVPTDGTPGVESVAANYYQPNALLGFVHRENQAIIVNFLQEETLAVEPGLPVTLMSRGDFWDSFLEGAAIGDKVYADPLTGAATAAPTGEGVQFAITASLAANGVLTVTVTAGALAPGQVITDVATGLVPPGTYIVSQLTGSTGSTGTYQLNQGVLVTSESMTATGVIETPWYVATAVPVEATSTGSSIAANTGILTLGTVTGGLFAVGQVISGTGIVATFGNPKLTALLTGNGGSGSTFQTTYTNYGAVSSTAIDGVQGTQGKISTWQTA
jgi:hypothetical protein